MINYFYHYFYFLKYILRILFINFDFIKILKKVYKNHEIQKNWQKSVARSFSMIS